MMGCGGRTLAAGAEVPLQVADPEDELGDGGGAGVDFDAEELVRVDGGALHLQHRLAFAQGVEGVEHLALEPLEVFEGDVEEVAGAAGGIEHAQPAEALVEGLRPRPPAFFVLPCFGQGHGGGVHGLPFRAQRAR